MNLFLSRKRRGSDGIFSELRDEVGNLVAITLEHAYVDTGWQPKIPNGDYQCVRGMHQLESMSSPFETFEITGVPGHSNILFHAGNYNADSEGCILVGQYIAPNPNNPGDQMITNSKDSFAKLMALQVGLNSFQLTVIG